MNFKLSIKLSIQLAIPLNENLWWISCLKRIEHPCKDFVQFVSICFKLKIAKKRLNDSQSAVTSSQF